MGKYKKKIEAVHIDNQDYFINSWLIFSNPEQDRMSYEEWKRKMKYCLKPEEIIMSTTTMNDRSFRMQTVIGVAGDIIGNNELNNINLAEVEKICGREANEQKFNIKDLISDNMNLVAYAARLRTLPRQKNRYGATN